MLAEALLLILTAMWDSGWTFQEGATSPPARQIRAVILQYHKQNAFKSSNDLT